MKFEIDIIEDVDQKQFNYHINKVYHDKIHSIVPFAGKVTITGDFTLVEKTEIENYYMSLPLIEEDYVINKLMVSYEQKEKDGHTYYNLKRSELVDKINKAEITESDAFTIDTKLKDVKDSLRSGDWITANSYLSIEPVEGPFTQVLKDEFTLEIGEYITNNY